MKELFLDLNLEFQVAFIVLGASFLIQLFYYFFFYARFAYKRTISKKVRNIPPVSVVICAKNEAENLKKNLPVILQQHYDNFEVIVVNDCSEDDTEEVVGEYKREYPNLVITNISSDKKFTHGKKLALTIGIKAAKNEWILLTDADCRPDSENWIVSMAGNFTNDNELVIGYGGYTRRKGIVNNLIRYDTVCIATQYFGYALAGIPYMGVGRNIAYKKSAFFNNKGFASHYHISSGDDDLFVNEIAKKSNTAVEFTHDSHTRSLPNKTFGEWIKQKRRHLTTGRYYKFKFKFLLALEQISRLIFYVAAVFLLTYKDLYVYALPFVIMKYIIHLMIFKNAMKRLKEKDLLLTSLLYDLVLPILYTLLGVINVITRKSYKWK